MSLSTKTLNTRVIQKHDTAENWAKAVSFIPKKGEIIIYDIDSTHTIPRFKIGDGTTVVSSLPFCDAELQTAIDTLETKTNELDNEKATLGTDGFYRSKRDFANGTLIATNIDYSVDSGAAWLMEIKGNSYGIGDPFDLTLQGYIYKHDANSPGMINYSGISNGFFFDDISAFCYNGVLCFWFPNLGYWPGFAVRVTDETSQTNENPNCVVSITDEIKPTNITKEVSFIGKITKSITSKNIGSQEVAYATNAGTASKANYLATDRKISLGGAVSAAPVMFNGSNDVNISVDTISEAYLQWGGKNLKNGFSPIDAAMIPEIGANRLAFMPASAITIEYSRDGGVTWNTYECTTGDKVNLFNGNATSLYIGASTDKNIDKSRYMLRVIIDTYTGLVYTTLNKFAIYCSTSGSDGCYCTIDARTGSDYDSNNDTWRTFADAVPISGWSGYNIINTPGLTTYGGGVASQYRQVRFTFGVTNHDNTVEYCGLTVNKIMGFGGAGWNTPSYMAKYGRMYTFDENQNVRFPANVSATNFLGTASYASKADMANVLTSARKINITGDAEGSASFDGSGDANIDITVSIPYISFEEDGSGSVPLI